MLGIEEALVGGWWIAECKSTVLYCTLIPPKDNLSDTDNHSVVSTFIPAMLALCSYENLGREKGYARSRSHTNKPYYSRPRNRPTTQPRLIHYTWSKSATERVKLITSALHQASSQLVSVRLCPATELPG